MGRLRWPLVMTLAMLATTMSLGVWQLQRLQWKRALLAEISLGEVTEPRPLVSDSKPFQRVIASGHFLPGVARYGIEIKTVPGQGPTMGAHVLSALASNLGVPVLVDRGWAPLDMEPPSATDPVTIVGYVRPPEHAPMLGVKDDPAARRFYALDPVAIGNALGFVTVAPFTLVVLGPKGTIPQPAEAMPRPPNDHLSYAITWFGLSAVLMTVFSVYACRTLRQASFS